jgi:hypothetical protein
MRLTRSVSHPSFVESLKHSPGSPRSLACIGSPQSLICWPTSYITLKPTRASSYRGRFHTPPCETHLLLDCHCNSGVTIQYRRGCRPPPPCNLRYTYTVCTVTGRGAYTHHTPPLPCNLRHTCTVRKLKTLWKRSLTSSTASWWASGYVNKLSRHLSQVVWIFECTGVEYR